MLLRSIKEDYKESKYRKGAGSIKIPTPFAYLYINNHSLIRL